MRILATSILFLLLSSGLHSQEYPEVYDASQHKGYNFMPENLVQFRLQHPKMQSVRIRLSLDGEHFRPFTVKRDDPLTVFLRMSKVAYTQICTASSRPCLNYKLKGAELYEVVWEPNKRRWELEEGDGR